MDVNQAVLYRQLIISLCEHFHLRKKDTLTFDQVLKMLGTNDGSYSVGLALYFNRLNQIQKGFKNET